MNKDLLIVPPIHPNLIQVLDQRFPDRCADPKDSEREIWMKAGERRLVTWLALQLAIQEDKD